MIDYELDAQLAEQIVQRTMQIIEYNINVMNAHGRIIASGDKARVGQKHDGAMLAIAKGENVALDASAATSLSGVKPGINLLLYYQDNVVGVIGITGEPYQVEQFGHLVKMAAELIIEQAQAWQSQQWGSRQREEFIVQWAQGATDWSVLQDWANRLEIDLNVPRVASVIEVRSVAPLKQRAMREVIELLEYPKRDNLVAMLSLNEIVVLKPHHEDMRQEYQRIERLLARTDALPGLDLVIAVGPYFSEPDRLYESYRAARQTLEVGKRLRPQSRQLFFYDFQLPVLLSQLEDDWRLQTLRAPFQALQAQDKSGLLKKTLQQYITDYPDQKLCAEHLHVHRDTLKYRLDKISQITGCSLSDLESLTRLYISSLL